MSSLSSSWAVRSSLLSSKPEKKPIMVMQCDAVFFILNENIFYWRLARWTSNVKCENSSHRGGERVKRLRPTWPRSVSVWWLSVRTCCLGLSEEVLWGPTLLPTHRLLLPSHAWTFGEAGSCSVQQLNSGGEGGCDQRKQGPEVSASDQHTHLLK